MALVRDAVSRVTDSVPEHAGIGGEILETAALERRLVEPTAQTA
ncbi:hypothetical protein [Streptomyces sp. NPDC006739]